MTTDSGWIPDTCLSTVYLPQPVNVAQTTPYSRVGAPVVGVSLFGSLVKSPQK